MNKLEKIGLLVFIFGTAGLMIDASTGRDFTLDFLVMVFGATIFILEGKSERKN